MKRVLKQRGQSILELAIFGSIFIGLLGLLINYGLNYNYQQKVTMEAHRKADSASGEGGSYMLIVDKHIPNPSNPFGVGSVTPVMSSASVTHNYHMEEVAENEGELPRTTIEIRGTDASYKKDFITAGFRYIPVPLLGEETIEPLREEAREAAKKKREEDVKKEGNRQPVQRRKEEEARTFVRLIRKAVGEEIENQIKKYEEIYGSSNVCSDPKQRCGASRESCAAWGPPSPQTGECGPPNIHGEINPKTGERACCVAYTLTIKIIDSCEGELMNYDRAKRQCRLIQNEAACMRDCRRGGKDDSECAAICSREIEVPWYCDKLDEIFAFQPIEKYKSMGLGQTYSQGTQMHNSFVIREDKTATDNVDWKTTTHRTIYTSDKSGGYREENVDTEVSQKESRAW